MLRADCPEKQSAGELFACAVTKIKKNIVNFFNSKAWSVEKTRRRAKTGLLKLFAELKNDTDPYAGTTRKNKIKPTTTTQSPYLGPVPQPIRKSNLGPLIGMTAEQLITAHGYKPESHHIYTEDGFVLTIHRMVQSTNAFFTEQFEKGVVMLHHGLLGSSEDWLLLETHSTLPALLSNSGYDVWLLNARGNKYTTITFSKFRHSYTSRDFSWHEIGVYDLPAVITYISNYTQGSDLYYIGHSMGATAMLVLLSTLPEYNDKLKSAIFFAPLAFMHHSRGPLKLFTEFPNSTQNFMANGTFPAEIMENFCQGTYRSCANTLLFITNGGQLIWDNDMMENILKHVPAGGSTKTIAHYMQLIRSARFRNFDYGPISNVKKYNTTFPPDYKLSAITLPISVFISSGDWISTISDTITLINKLHNVKTLHIVRKDNFSHLDFLWSRDVQQLVYKVVMDLLDSLSKANSEESNKIEVSSTADDLVTDDD